MVPIQWFQLPPSALCMHNREVRSCEVGADVASGCVLAYESGTSSVSCTVVCGSCVVFSISTVLHSAHPASACQCDVLLADWLSRYDNSSVNTCCATTSDFSLETLDTDPQQAWWFGSMRWGATRRPFASSLWLCMCSRRVRWERSLIVLLWSSDSYLVT